MIDIKLIQDFRITFFCIWLILMLYGFYKYYKNTDFKNMSLSHFICASFIFFLCGHITTAMFFGIEHLLLLPFMPFGIWTLIRWYKYNVVIFLSTVITPFLLLPLLYCFLIKPIRRIPKLLMGILVLFWISLFYGGYVLFLYMLVWNIF